MSEVGKITQGDPSQMAMNQANAYRGARERQRMMRLLWEFVDCAAANPRSIPDEEVWEHVMAYFPPKRRQAVIDMWVNDK